MKLKCVVGNNKKTHVWCDVCVEVRGEGGEGGYNLILNVFKRDMLGACTQHLYFKSKMFFPYVIFFV